MKFRTPDGVEPLRVALTSGHVCKLGHEFREVPEQFHRPFLALGAECDATIIKTKETPKTPTPTGEPNEIVEAKIKEMIERDKPGDFTGAGLPNLKVLSQLCGFTVSKDVMATIFAKLNAESGQN